MEGILCELKVKGVQKTMREIIDMCEDIFLSIFSLQKYLCKLDLTFSFLILEYLTNMNS